MTNERELHHLCPFCKGPLTATVEWSPPDSEPYTEHQVPLLHNGFKHSPAMGPGGEGRIELIVCSNCHNHLPPSYYTHGHELPALPWGIEDSATNFRELYIHYRHAEGLESAQIDLRAARFIQHAVNMYVPMLNVIDVALDEMQHDMKEGIDWSHTPLYKEAMRVREMCAGAEAPVKEGAG